MHDTDYLTAALHRLHHIVAGAPIAYVAETEAELDEAKAKASADGSASAPTNGAVATPEPAAAPAEAKQPQQARSLCLQAPSEAAPVAHELDTWHLMHKRHQPASWQVAVPNTCLVVPTVSIMPCNVSCSGPTRQTGGLFKLRFGFN